jgi:hypothetical protein
MIVFAIIGSKALWLLYLWLGSSIVCSYLAERKGYVERHGLATGMLLSFIGVLVWLVIPPKPDSTWRRAGAFGRAKETDVPPADTES